MNDVSDTLSQDDNRSGNELIKIFSSFIPSQIPDHFDIVPLPKEISSWMIYMLHRLPMKEQLRERHTRTKIRRGQGAKTTADQLELSRMSYLTTLTEANKLESWEPLPWLSVKGHFQDHLMEPGLKAQSKVPFHLSQIPSGKMTGQTQQNMKTVNLQAFYRGST